MAMRNFNQNSPRPRAQSYRGQQNVNPSAAYPGQSPNYLNNPRFQPAGQTGDQDVSVVRQTRTQVIETEPENQGSFLATPLPIKIFWAKLTKILFHNRKFP